MHVQGRSGAGPFSGGGSTLIAADRTKREARCIEIDPLYVDLIIRRWEGETGKQAVHIETGLTFEALNALRAREAAASLEEVGDDR